MYAFTLHTESKKVGWLVASIRSLLSNCPDTCWHRNNGTCYAKQGRYGMQDKNCKHPLETLLAWIKALRNPYLRLWTSGDFPDDPEAAAAIVTSVPRRVVAWGYTHRGHSLVDHLNALKKNVTISLSVERVEDAIRHSKQRPTVISIGRPEFWQGHRSRRIEGTLFVRCPADYREGFQCQECGGGRPLCARTERDYVIGLDLHGPRIKESHKTNLSESNGFSFYRPLEVTP